MYDMASSIGDEANILRVVANISLGMASILSGVPDILHVQHQFFEMFQSIFGFSNGKIHFFPKVLKIGLVAKKLIITF